MACCHASQVARAGHRRRCVVQIFSAHFFPVFFVSVRCWNIPSMPGFALRDTFVWTIPVFLSRTLELCSVRGNISIEPNHGPGPPWSLQRTAHNFSSPESARFVHVVVNCKTACSCAVLPSFFLRFYAMPRYFFFFSGIPGNVASVDENVVSKLKHPTPRIEYGVTLFPAFEAFSLLS